MLVIFLPQVEKGATAASNGAVTSIGNYSMSLAVGHLQRERGVTIRRPYCRGMDVEAWPRGASRSYLIGNAWWAGSVIHRECGECIHLGEMSAESGVFCRAFCPLTRAKYSEGLLYYLS
jgi:hypothetical protein